MPMHRREFIRVAGAAALGTAGVLSRIRVAAPFQAPQPIVRLPYLQNVTRNGGRILWTTRESGVAAVEYSADNGFSSAMTAVTREFKSAATGVATFYQHEAKLEGLRADTSYRYRILQNGRSIFAADDLRLRTAGTRPFTFLVFGDAGQATAGQTRCASAMMRENPGLVLMAGDIAYMSGTYDEFQRNFFRYYQEMLGRVPIYPTAGNHDYTTADAAPYLSMFSVPGEDVPAADRGRYYSFDWGNVHFVSLDSNTPLNDAVFSGGGMLDWLEKDLQKTKQFWRVAYFHHPPYAAGPNERDALSRLAREYIVPVLERYGVQAVFSGHEHSYQRSRTILGGQYVEPDAGIAYFTSGGGGADLYDPYPGPLLVNWEKAHHFMRVAVSGTTMTVRAIRSDETEIESVRLAPQPIITSVSTAAASASSLSPVRRGVVRIVGRQLSAEENLDTTNFPPNEVNGTVVHLDGRRLPLAYVSGSEITALLRVTGRGSALLRVTTPNGWTETTTYF
jgi:hypothetical protein